MDSLTKSEVTRIAKLQRHAGVQRLSRHFLWSEFSDQMRCFHQEFVYDVFMFTKNRGFSWPDVIRSAELARSIFPQLDGQSEQQWAAPAMNLNVHKLLSSLRHMLFEHLPTLTPVHHHEIFRYLTDTCIKRKRLFQAVIGGAAGVTTGQLQLEVKLPPVPCALAKGTDLHQWETQIQHRARLFSSLQQKEEELRCLRDGPRVTLEAGGLPEDRKLDKPSILELVQAEVRTAESQIVATLNQEASLLADILLLKVQQGALATAGRPSAAPSHTSKHTDIRGKESGKE
ncbi:uncharacterized protein C8orf74 homolog isoform 2-T2 [Odontesthes bonariensis]|uniref:uncharacterized protein C8orf74 homolog isoform X2 n=1 Tax=Odontesthes bonariensis TaxID=219752 RepID=UPI003F58705C